MPAQRFNASCKNKFAKAFFDCYMTYRKDCFGELKMTDGHTPSIASHWEEVLKKCLSDLKTKYPKASQAQIAEKITIPRPTLNRLYNGTQKPQLATLLKLIISSGNLRLLDDAIKSFDEKVGKTLKSIIAVASTEKNANFADDELETLLQDRDVFVCYLMASIKNGCEKWQVVDALGSVGLEAMKKLVELNLIDELDGHYTKKDDRILVRSFESIKLHLGTYMRFYRPEHVGMNRNYAHSLSDGLNTKGLARLQGLHQQFHADCMAVMRDEEFRGSTPVFSVAFCDTFTSAEGEEKGGNWQ
ncbi:MAG: hypothetical protein A2X86_21585 [Bdellovibrionales bacterium GWA2_49_15]|nr:MAG: hypothetical protein A2X86_21585 [Bdellovibrionales bacterium GWA2_49_15]